jgi:hypothetical protein
VLLNVERVWQLKLNLEIIGICYLLNFVENFLQIYRVMSAYISKGTRLTIHTNSNEHRSERNITVFVKAGEIPTQRNNDFKVLENWHITLQITPL